MILLYHILDQNKFLFIKLVRRPETSITIISNFDTNKNHADFLSDRGAWTRDIKFSTNIPQQMLTKALKTLEQRNLIKSVRSVSSKSKKLYMLYDLVPAKEITGGPWYTDQEFDHEFIQELSKFIIQFIRAQGMTTLNSINERVRISGISKVSATSSCKSCIHSVSCRWNCRWRSLN